jgi:hypothetical protein
MKAPLSPEQIQIRRDKEMLVMASAVVLLALLLEVLPDGKVAFFFLPDFPAPGTCPSHEWFGINCPGCGLTRSIILLAHGDWTASWQMHRVGWLLALAIVLQFPYRIASLRRGGKPVLGTVFPSFCGYMLIALLLGNWLFNVVCDGLFFQASPS